MSLAPDTNIYDLIYIHRKILLRIIIIWMAYTEPSAQQQSRLTQLHHKALRRSFVLSLCETMHAYKIGKYFMKDYSSHFRSVLIIIIIIILVRSFFMCSVVHPKWLWHHWLMIYSFCYCCYCCDCCCCYCFFRTFSSHVSILPETIVINKLYSFSFF